MSLSIYPTDIFAAEDITWKHDIIFTKTTYDEDITVVLKEVLKRNGTEVFFRPGVEGKVTFEFTNVPLQAVFNKLVEENGLAYEYLPATKTVTISKRGAHSVTEEIFTPKFSNLEDVYTALQRFNLLEGDIKIKSDPLTNSLFLKGDQVKVANIKRIADRIDDAYNNKNEKDLKAQQLDMEMKFKARQQEMEMKSMDTTMASNDIKVKVIPLRYANVGTSKTTFQGESVTLPGIIESLKAFVGAVEVRDDRTDKTPDPKMENAIAKAIALGPMGKPVVAIDQRTNSVIVQGTTEQIERIENVIKELDQEVDLVEIEVMIVDGLADVTRQLGLNWGMQGNIGDGNQLKTPTNVVSSGTVAGLTLIPKELSPASSVTTLAGVPGTVSATAATVASTNQSGVMQLYSRSGLGAAFIFQGAREVLDATLSALAKDDKLQTIASPRVVTINNLTAQITNSNNTSFIVTTGDGTKSDIKTVSSGISLEITPSIIPPLPSKKGQEKDFVRLTINARNSTPGASTKDSMSTNDQQVRTNVIIPKNSTFIMGGLFNTSRAEVETGVPGLKDLPLLGMLFRNNTSQEQKRETIFLITPKIFKPNEIVADLHGKKAKSQMERQRYFLNREQDDIQNKSKLIDLRHMVEEDE